MPHADPERKKRWQKQWNANAMKQGYGKWLYKRRKAFQDDAADFRQALEEIANTSDELDSIAIAHSALSRSEQRWQALREERKSIHTGEKG